MREQRQVRVHAGPCRGMETTLCAGDVLIVIKKPYASHATVAKGQPGVWMEWKRGYHHNHWLMCGTLHHPLYDAIYERMKQDEEQFERGGDLPAAKELPKGAGVQGNPPGVGGGGDPEGAWLQA
jgi:hypothetical protein